MTKSTYAFMAHFVDVLAIPGFAIATLYFATMSQKSVLEYLLLAFVGIGLLVDSVLSSHFLGSAVYVIGLLVLTVALWPTINETLSRK
jgi:hypothetical protein